MKKLISILLTAAMLASAVAVSASADGQLYVKSDFTSMGTLDAHFHAGAYFIEEEGLLYGYNEAKCLQSKGEWYQYDTEIEVNFADDDLSDAERAYSLWYPNTNLEAYGRFDGCNYMRFGYSVENGEFYFSASDLDTAESVDLMPRVPAELDDDTYHKFGISVSDKRVRCFCNGELIFDFVDTADDYLIGREDENTNPTALVYWNDGNFIQIRDVQIASPGYLYPFEMANPDVTSTSINTVYDTDEPDVTTTTEETTTRIESSVVTKDNGETEIVTKIITEATDPAPAATNTGKPAGGSSTATGDAAFVVVAAMVATLGCALIIRKASVQ